jgi:beta-lactamase regulating signal transducer with metallopeptidase domain
MDATPRGRRFDVGSQSAGNINNVQRDQYIQYVRAQRESFLREVAATRTKARWLVWLGLIAMLAGIGIFFWAFAGTFGSITDAFQSVGDPAVFQQAFDSFGQEIAGVNAFILGMLIAAVGQIMLIVGIVLHIVATARRKRADRELAAPPAWLFDN